ncbi:hypothetical protein ES703_89558 [subsurface metagenome]
MDILQRTEAIVRGVSIAALPGEILPAMPGDIVKVTAEIDYRGPALDDIFYGAIGIRTLLMFDEIWKNEAAVHFDQSYDWVRYRVSVAIPITEIGLFPWTPGLFDLYVKLDGHPEAGMPELANVIRVMLEAEFQNFGIVSYEKV